jgi:small subunit ribosomal protein S20
MPVTKTAKRALRSSKNKESVNRLIMTKLEIAIRNARKSKTSQKIISAISLADKAAKKKVIHKNKAARIKAQLAKLLVKKSENQSSPKTRKTKKTTGRKTAK